MSKSKMKTMLISFFYVKGIVHFEFITQDQTIKQAYYVEILKQLCEATNREKPELRLTDWILPCDNVPAHKALSVKQFLDQKLITEMEYLLYSPDWPQITSGCCQK
jgi:hypothetical protein